MISPTATDALCGHEQLLRRIPAVRRRAFAPPPGMSLSEWADERRVISPEKSPTEHGRWHTDRTPYLREIMDACVDPAVERVVFPKSARVGGTEVMNNAIGYSIDQDPCPMLVLQPTVDDAKDWSKEDLTPMLRDTPCLAGKVVDSGRRDSRNTIQMKMFPGGYLAVVGTNSARGFRRRSIRKVFADEVDGYGVSARGSKHREGDPLTLAIKRTENVWNRFIYETSTPTVKGASRIMRDYDLSDQRRYFVPCPHCGHEQTLKWSNFKWENNDPSTVVYVCGELDPKSGEVKAGRGALITEEHKPRMVESGRWIAQRPGRPWRGYHIWAGYSLLTTWTRIVQQWIEAQGDSALLQVFVNQVLGEVWEEKVGEQPEHSTLVARRENYSQDVSIEVPMDAGVLTAGVDVQGDRLEYSCWAWGAGEQAWLVKHETLWGNPTEQAVWDQLDLAVFRDWKHASGALLKIMATCVDSGGHHADEVYRYGLKHLAHRVYITKGMSEVGRAPVGKPSKVYHDKLPLFPLGTEALKDMIYDRIKLPAPGPKYMHFPYVDEEYFRQLVAEAVHTKYERGRPIRRYVKKYERNEALDCAVGALAALIILGPVRDQLALFVQRVQATSAGKPGPSLGGGHGRRVRSSGL